MPFSSAKPLAVKVNSYSLVTVYRNQYSVPCHYTGRMIIAKAYVDHIDLIVGCNIVATYERSYKRDQVYMEINHYLPALERKPHAVTHASVVRQLPAIFSSVREKMTTASPQGYKDFLAVLLLLREYSVFDVAKAMEMLEPSEVNLAILRKILDPKAVVLTETTDIMTTTEHAAQYGRLLQEVI